MPFLFEAEPTPFTCWIVRSGSVLEPPAQLELDPLVLKVPNVRAKGSLSPVLAVIHVGVVLIQSVFESPSC